MSLNRVKLGTLIELNLERNEELLLGKADVYGMTIDKQIISTKADVNEKELPKFYVCKKNDFIYNPRTHGKKIGLGFSTKEHDFLISWNNISFRVRDLDILDPYFLYAWFNRPEWDRNATFRSWGSSTVVFSWDELCDMDFDLPPINVQRKYVAIYKAMVANQQAYENGLEDLKLTCEAYIERLKHKYIPEKIGESIKRVDIKNSENKIKNVKNVSVFKCFNEPTAKVNRNDLKAYKIVKPRQISFVQTTHNEKVFAYAFNKTDESIVVTSVNEVFETDENKLLPEFLCMFFNRKEFDRYARFHSWGSARETFTWTDLCEVLLPIPPLEIQQDIVNIYNVYLERKKINEELKEQIKNICPILIKGAIKEAEEL